uniref:Uncharacterized protein n=1 Tax=Panagrolaimus sp. ES5 TaxID=591445 RepID=A0AC34FJA8_9BILA
MDDDYFDCTEARQLIDPNLDMVSPYPEMCNSEATSLEVSSTDSSEHESGPTKPNPIKFKKYPGITDNKEVLDAAYWNFNFLPENEFDSIVKANAIDNSELISNDNEAQQNEKILREFNNKKNMVQLIKDNKFLERKCEKLEAKFCDAEFQIENNQNEIGRYKESLSVVEAEKQKLRTLIKAIKVELEEKRCQFDKDLQNAIDNCSAKIRELQIQNKKVYEIIEKKNQENEISKAQRIELNKENEELFNKMDKMAKNNKLLSEKCDSLESETAEKEKHFAKELNAAKNENSKLQEKLKDSEKNVKEMGQQLSSLKIEADEKEKAFVEELKAVKDKILRLESELKDTLELNRQHSAREITSAAVEKILNEKLCASNAEIKKLKTNLKMVDEDIQEMRKHNVELKIEYDEMKRQLKNDSNESDARTNDPKKINFDAEIIEDPTMATPKKVIAASDTTDKSVKEQQIESDKAVDPENNSDVVEVVEATIENEADQIKDKNLIADTIAEELKVIKVRFAENLLLLEQSKAQVAELQSTLSLLKFEYQQIHQKLRESEAAVAQCKVENQNLETKNAQLQSSIHLQNSAMKTPQNDYLQNSFQKLKQENAALKSKIQEERKNATSRFAQLLQQNSCHLEEKKQCLNFLHNSIIMEKRAESFQLEIVKLNNELKYYREAFSSSCSTDEVVPPKRKRKHSKPQFCNQQQQQTDITDNLTDSNIDVFPSTSTAFNNPRQNS